MTTPNYSLRLQADLKKEAELTAKKQGTTLNQFINVAIAEKLTAMKAAEFFNERAKRANLPETLRMLKRVGLKKEPRDAKRESKREKNHDIEHTMRVIKEALSDLKEHEPASR